MDSLTPKTAAAISNDSWIHFDKQKLEEEYSPSRWSKRGDADWVIQNHVNLVTQISNEVKQSVECQLDIPYGSRDAEKFDLYGAQTLPTDAPVFIYIHGGYWQALDRNISAYSVPPLSQAGCIVAVVGYDLAPNVEFEEIVEQVAKAVSVILKWAAERGTRKVVIGGHSAGSHLCAMLLHNSKSSWAQNEPNIHLIRGMVHISGVFDLVPLVNTYVNDPLKLNEELARQFSPLHQIDQLLAFKEQLNGVEFLIVVGEYDSAEFKRQTSAYARALESVGLNVKCEVMTEMDHFNIVECLQEADYKLIKQIISLLTN